MGKALDLVTGFATAPGATQTNWTMAAGDSLQVKNTATPTTPIYMLNMWAQNQAGGDVSVHSPKMHDNVQGIRVRNNTGDTLPLWGRGLLQKMYPQDVLIATISGSATAGQIEQGSLMFYYDDIPGISAQLFDWPTIQKRVVNIFPVRASLTPGVAGGYSGQQAINFTIDLFKANTFYALFGFHASAQATSIAVRGPDTGNIRCGCPCDPTIVEWTEEWFKRLSQETGLATIPVINSANKFNTFIDVAQNQAGTAVTADMIFAELTPQ